MKQYNVGVIGATGMVGQRFITLLENHPWFNLVALAASARSAGKTYEEAVGSRWLMTTPMPESVKKMVVLDAANVEEVAAKVDFVFCAVNMKKDEIKALEEAYAKAECPVVSNNSAHRFTPDVPMVVPEINADHIDIIPAQRKRLGTKRGFIAVKSNCSLQSYVPALHPLMKDGSTLENAIARERELLAPVRNRASAIIDTSNLSTGKLRGQLIDLVAGGMREHSMDVRVASFGFKYGLPLEADLVFDVRFLPNPYYIPERLRR